MSLFDFFDIFDLFDIAEMIADIYKICKKKRSTENTAAGNMPETECGYDLKKEKTHGDKGTEETNAGGYSRRAFRAGI